MRYINDSIVVDIKTDAGWMILPLVTSIPVIKPIKRALYGNGRKLMTELHTRREEYGYTYNGLRNSDS